MRLRFFGLDLNDRHKLVMLVISHHLLMAKDTLQLSDNKHVLNQLLHIRFIISLLETDLLAKVVNVYQNGDDRLIGEVLVSFNDDITMELTHL